jgi:hypothetical protein
MVGVRVLNIQHRRFGQATLRIEERKGLARANLLVMNLLRKNGFTRVTKGTTGPQRPSKCTSLFTCATNLSP